MNKNKKRQALEKIEEILKEIECKMKDAQKIADRNGLVFHFYGFTRGMGGTYEGKGSLTSEEKPEGIWIASAGSC